MGWKRLGAELETEKTTATVLELITGMQGGSARHRADALKFGLYTALRRKDPNSDRLALLKCVREGCQARDQHVSYQSLVGGTICVTCLAGIPACSNCGHVRNDHWTWCEGCRMIFG